MPVIHPRIRQNLGHNQHSRTTSSRVFEGVPFTMNNMKGEDTFADKNSLSILYTTQSTITLIIKILVLTMDNTTIDNIGNGVEYTSPAPCSKVGIGTGPGVTDALSFAIAFGVRLASCRCLRNHGERKDRRLRGDVLALGGSPESLGCGRERRNGSVMLRGAYCGE